MRHRTLLRLRFRNHRNGERILRRSEYGRRNHSRVDYRAVAGDMHDVPVERVQLFSAGIGYRNARRSCKCHTIVGRAYHRRNRFVLGQPAGLYGIVQHLRLRRRGLGRRRRDVDERQRHDYAHRTQRRDLHVDGDGGRRAEYHRLGRRHDTGPTVKASVASVTVPGAGVTATFTASQSGYTGAFTTSGCGSSVATASAGATANNAATITVTGGFGGRDVQLGRDRRSGPKRHDTRIRRDHHGDGQLGAAT